MKIYFHRDLIKMAKKISIIDPFGQWFINSFHEKRVRGKESTHELSRPSQSR